jgi:polar amino acid transport system substrate-binding protein
MRSTEAIMILTKTKVLLLAFCLIITNATLATSSVASDLIAPLKNAIPLETITIQAYCEDYNPYNFAENGVITGFSVDLLRAISKQAKIDISIEIVPWKRYLKVVENTPNTLLFTATRNRIREDRFKWIGPIDGRTQKLYKLKKESTIWDMKIDTRSNNTVLESIHREQYPIIAVSGDASEKNLTDQGYRVFSGPKPELNVKQFINERAPLIVNVDISIASKLKIEGRSFSEIEEVAVFNDDFTYFYMVNKETDTEIVYRLQKALDVLKYNGVYKNIRNKWLN